MPRFEHDFVQTFPLFPERLASRLVYQPVCGVQMAGIMQELCDYEKRRLENVEKNIELMKTLGKILLYVK